MKEPIRWDPNDFEGFPSYSKVFLVIPRFNALEFDENSECRVIYMYKTSVFWGPTWILVKKSECLCCIFSKIAHFHDFWKNAYFRGKIYTEKTISRKKRFFFSIFFLEKRYGWKLPFREETKWKKWVMSECSTFYISKFRFFPYKTAIIFGSALF